MTNGSVLDPKLVRFYWGGDLHHRCLWHQQGEIALRNGAGRLLPSDGSTPRRDCHQSRQPGQNDSTHESSTGVERRLLRI